MILINIINQGDISVYKENDLFLKMKRKTPIPFLRTSGEIFNEKNENEAMISYGYFNKKVVSQKLNETLEIKKQNLFGTGIAIKGNNIYIKNNPFYHFNNKYFSKIFCNDRKIAQVSLARHSDAYGFILEVDYDTEDARLIKDSLIGYLICCIGVNLV